MTDERIDPARQSFLRGAAMPRTATRSISRRSMLRSMGGLAGVGAMSALLAGCGIRGTEQDAQVAQGINWGAWWAKQKVNGHFAFDNWAAYIDVTNHGNHPTLEMFTKKTGISVSYNDAAVADTAS